LTTGRLLTRAVLGRRLPFFRMFEQLFGAGERFASALNHIGEWTDESAAAYADQARLERKAAQIQGKQQLAALK